MPISRHGRSTRRTWGLPRDPQLQRREFLKIAGGVSLASILGDSPSTALQPRSIFESNSPEVLALAQRVMKKCAL